MRAIFAEARRWRSTPRAAVAWLVAPPLLCALIASIRFIDRDYLRRLSDEDGLLEWIQALAFLIAAVCSAATVWTLFGRARKVAALLFGLFGLALVFALGEELAWGQRLFGFETPDELARVNEKQELSLHNVTWLTDWFTLAKLAIGVYGACGALALAWLRRRWEVAAVELLSLIHI